MKAEIYDEIETLEVIPSDFGKGLIAKGTRGTVVECYSQPEGYAIDLSVARSSLVGDFDYENVILRPDQFVLVRKSEKVAERSPV